MGPRRAPWAAPAPWLAAAAAVALCGLGAAGAVGDGMATEELGDAVMEQEGALEKMAAQLRAVVDGKDSDGLPGIALIKSMVESMEKGLQRARAEEDMEKRSELLDAIVAQTQQFKGALSQQHSKLEEEDSKDGPFSEL